MVEHAWKWTLRETIPSDTAAGHRVIDLLIKALDGCGWVGRDLFHVQMAAEEAMVNCVTHGNQQAADKVVEIEFRVSPRQAYMRFKDQGEGFNPDDLPDPRDDEHLECINGRGVMLIHEMMDEICYNAVGNEVTMVKFRESAAS